MNKLYLNQYGDAIFQNELNRVVERLRNMAIATEDSLVDAALMHLESGADALKHLHLSQKELDEGLNMKSCQEGCLISMADFVFNDKRCHHAYTTDVKYRTVNNILLCSNSVFEATLCFHNGSSINLGVWKHIDDALQWLAHSSNPKPHLRGLDSTPNVTVLWHRYVGEGGQGVAILKCPWESIAPIFPSLETNWVSSNVIFNTPFGWEPHPSNEIEWSYEGIKKHMGERLYR